MNVPSASEMSEKLIRDNPELFPGNFIDTKLAIMKVMHQYEQACNKYVHRDSLFEMAANIVRTDAKVRLGALTVKL